jgi:hypothetical protein
VSGRQRGEETAGVAVDIRVISPAVTRWPTVLAAVWWVSLGEEAGGVVTVDVSIAREG